MISVIQFILYCRTNYASFSQNAHSYIQLNEGFSTKRKEILTRFSDDFMQFIIKQDDIQNGETLQLQLHLFLQMHAHELSDDLLNDLRIVFEQATLRLLFQQKHPKTEQMFLFVSNQLHVLLKHYYLSQQQTRVEAPQNNQALDMYSELLIHSSGPDDLPFIIEQIKRLFGFKRCVFYEYIPWSNEVRGLFGENLKTIQNIRGKRSSTFPFFNSTNPIYLKRPQKYIEDWMIQKFNLASILFIPVRTNEQLFGWLEFDQVGLDFPYNQQQIDTLHTAGQRLALMLSRKPVLHQTQHDKELSDKEQTILQLITEGKSNKEIAEVLFLSEYTVRDYVQKLLALLDAINRTHLVKKAYTQGYIS